MKDKAWSFDDLVSSRHSCRKYKTTPVPHETIKHLIEIACNAPSSCNRQLWKFIVLDRQFFHDKLAKHCPNIEAINSPHVIFVCYDSQYNPEHHANIQSAAAATMTLIYAAHNLRLGALWMAGIGNEQAIRHVCNIPQELMVCCAVCLGYSEEPIFESTLRPINDVLHFGPIKNPEIYPRSWNPEHWTLEQHRNNLDFTIHAKSPDERFYKPYLQAEFEAELAAIPKCKGKCLYFNPFAGNYLFPLIKDGRLPKDVCVFGLSKRNNEFLEEKRKRMNVDADIDWKHGIDALPYKDETFNNVLCIYQLQKFSKSQQEYFMQEFFRILKPDGILLVINANHLSPYWLAWRWKNQKELPGLRGPFEPNPPFNFNKLAPAKGISFPYKPKYVTRGMLRWLCKTHYHVISKEALM